MQVGGEGWGATHNDSWAESQYSCPATSCGDIGRMGEPLFSSCSLLEAKKKSEGGNWVEGDAGEDKTSAAIISPTWVGGGAAGGMAEEAGSSISNRRWVVAMGSLVVVHCLGVTRHDDASCLDDVARKGKSTRSPMFQAAQGLGCVRLPTSTVDIAPRKVSGKFWLSRGIVPEVRIPIVHSFFFFYRPLSQHRHVPDISSHKQDRDRSCPEHGI